MTVRVRNRGCMPDISAEGIFLKPLVPKEYRKDDWEDGLSPFERVHIHNTLASARRFACFRPKPGLIPRDDLDFVLSSCYDHTYEIFPDPVDVLLQPSTEDKGIARMRNDRVISTNPLEDTKKAAEMERELEEKERNKARGNQRDHQDYTRMGKKKRNEPTIPYSYNYAHKVLIGGVLERKHPSNIKLMNSSHHSPQTNAGFSRQPSDGTVFQY